MSSDVFYIVRLSTQEFLGKDKKPTEFLADAQQFDSEEAATAKAKGAIGISKYQLVGGKPEPQMHLSLSKED